MGSNPVAPAKPFFKKGDNMSNVNKENQNQLIGELMEKLSPYMPPILQGTRFIWFNGETLFLKSDSNDEIFHNRLKLILKEEFDFIKNIEIVSEEK